MNNGENKNRYTCTGCMRKYIHDNTQCTMENNSSLLEILTQYEVLISYRSKLLDLDPTITRLDLYRDWINGEISGVMLKIQKLCWNVIYAAKTGQDSVCGPPADNGEYTLDESDEREKVILEDNSD